MLHHSICCQTRRCVLLVILACFVVLSTRSYAFSNISTKRLTRVGTTTLYQNKLLRDDSQLGLDNIHTPTNGDFTSDNALVQDAINDFDKLSIIRPPSPLDDISAPTTLISAGSSYTRVWSASTWERHSRPPHRRYVRHVLRWYASTTARVIMPTVLAATTWAFTLSIAAQRLNFVKVFFSSTSSSTSISFLSAPLALILTLRANASMGRLLEARLLWGRLVLHARSLANAIRVYTYPHSPAASILMLRYTACIGWVLKSFVRGESKEYELQVLETMLDKQEYDWIKSQNNRIVALTSRMRQIGAVAMSAVPPNQYTSLNAAHWMIEQRISDLEAVVGGCERLFRSPIPPTYCRHLSRIIVLWLVLMPAALVSTGLSTLGVVLATLTSSYVLVGIDEVGMEIENCFLLLPLQQLAAAAQTGAREQFFLDSLVAGSDSLPPPVIPV